MDKVISVSFEGDIVKVVYAGKKGKDITVKDVLTLKEREFDDFLSREKTNAFIVVNSFKEFFQEILSLPITKKNILKNLVREEVKKRSDIREFSFIYFVLGEKMVDNIKMNEVFVFAVKNDEIKSIVDRFILKGKTVKALYPDIFSLASQIEMDDPALCVSGTGFNKRLFLVKDKVVNFVRIIQSFENGLSDLDIQNINMTINYCGQTMRITPSYVLIFGSLCSSYEVSSYTSTPVACFPSKSETFLDFVSPASAFSAGKNLNILSDDYRAFYNLKLFLQSTTIIFAILSFFGLGYLGYLVKDIIAKKTQLDLLRGDISGIELVLSSYESRKAVMSSYIPFMNDLKDVESFPDITGLMVLISSLKTDNIKLDSASIKRDANIFKVELKGQVKAENYASIQSHYERFIKSIEDKSAETRNAKLRSHSIELKTRIFMVEMEYR